MTETNLKSAWQAAQSELELMPLEAIHARAEQFSNTIGKRNMREYVAGFLVILIFGIYALTLPSMLLKAGSLLTCAAAALVMWQLHMRTSRPQSADATESVIDHYRQRLATERDALASVGWWYVAPFVPGFLLFSFGEMKEQDEVTMLSLLLQLGFPVIVFTGILLLNLRGARRLQRKIDAIDYARSNSGQ
ncbi:hypothetical protein DXH95_03405 [Sphingorhabdus pulchriflava]|uniref:Uncharacterized protein n=1 Tax=Sphingorhabdus pulchriflava TaxID=2292257 RepID=A0A371BGE3_9SPHN|nr:hypothetical protein [Sphingorhabdus pulchriflava]RDV06483.1 hypothetical protein DXH95_03405 [Sphingorhabdus pulchriflava]